VTAYSSPILVPVKGDPQVLKRVPLSGSESTATYDEAWLQNLLYAHPVALPVEDIDTSFTGLVPLCREMPTRAGPVDVVYVTRDGRPVLVEAKLWRNPEARRKVIGQILDYAKELANWDVDDLNAAVRQARSKEGEKPGKGLLELLGLDKDSPEAAQFHDSLARNLKRGELLLLIAGDGIRENVGAITDFLEAHGTLNFTFGLVEVAIFRTQDGGHLVHPRVVVRSDIVKRIVVDLRTGAVEEETDLASESQEGPPDNERATALNAFWTSFLKDLHLDRTDQPVGAPVSSGNIFFKMPTGRNGWVSAYVARSVDKAGVYLTIRKGAIGDRVYLALSQDRAVIDKELGVPAVWKESAREYSIVTDERFPGPILEVSADVVRGKLVDWANRYVNTFRPRLEALVRDLG